MSWLSISIEPTTSNDEQGVFEYDRATSFCVEGELGSFFPHYFVILEKKQVQSTNADVVLVFDHLQLQ
jgi:hypothetical protein